MRLSDLIAFRQRLNETTVELAKKKAKYELDIVMHQVLFPPEDDLPKLSEDHHLGNPGHRSSWSSATLEGVLRHARHGGQGKTWRRSRNHGHLHQPLRLLR